MTGAGKGGLETSPPPESFGGHERLRRRPDYLRCYRQGRRRHGRLVSLHWHPNDLSHPRLGITVGRKVGKAVVRQRLRRRIREAYRRWQRRPELPPVDLVVHVKPPAREAGWAELRQELERLWATLPG